MIQIIDFSKIGSNTSHTQLHPRDIFMGLPARQKQYEYPRDVQSEVWKQWYDARDNKNNIIKMNTGSGKTVVGLLILSSCINEGKGPAAFVVPDNFLIQQVCLEAERLGINVVTDPDDLRFLRKQAILVINIHALVNGKSKFGMRIINNIHIGSIIIDDVHACLATIETQYSVSVPATDSLYTDIVNLFSDVLNEQSENKFSDIVDNEDATVNMLVPFWAWQAKQREVYALLSQNAGNDYIDFNFQLLKDCLSLCNCMLSSKRIEIIPKCIPFHKISSFVRATRRIFMSATLADDSAFVTALGLVPSDIENIISPEKANDIGDRLILFPQVMNKQISDEQIKLQLKEMSKKHNVVVIVPSYFRAEFWRDVSDLELSAINITEGVDRLKAGHVGLTVLINKYDGIDLPDDACRILVIDGLPRMRSEYDSFEQNANPLNRRLCSEQIQKIEQGMGRGVRSNSDYSVVVLLGRGLADIIYSSEGIGHFSDATKAQFQLSEQLWDQLKSPSIYDVMNLANYSLSRDMQWVSASKEIMSNIRYSAAPNFNPVSIATRVAFDFAESGQYQEAVTAINTEKNRTNDLELRGLLKQYIAEYTNFFNPEEAQQILLSAHSDNRMVLRPIRGIQFDRVLNKTGAQAQCLIDYISKNSISPNSYILRVNATLENLTFSKDTSKIFENAMCDISFLLGIYSNRPEDEYGKGPDNFWDIGNSSFFVIECKNGTIVETISKRDCNQLNGSINWFESIYRSNNFICYPIMIHNSRVFEYACSPHERIRIMTSDLLLDFKNNVAQFAENIVKPEIFNNAIKVNQLLNQFKLLGKQIVDNYTTSYTAR